MKRKVMSKSNRIFYIVNTVLLMICLLLVAMPILNVVASVFVFAKRCNKRTGIFLA